MRKGTTMTAARARRLEAVRAILERRRAELSEDVGGRMRDVRGEGSGDRDVRDAAESSEDDIQDDIGFALIQMKAETLKKIHAALRRIDEGDYGDCAECGGDIADARLRALPFAVRCRDCEAVHETTTVRMTDANGPRGGVDHVCNVKVVLSGLPSVVVERRDASPRVVIDLALRTTAQAVRRSLRRRRMKPLRRRHAAAGAAPR